MNLFSVVVKGGWLMIPIVLCSFIAAAIIIERWITLRKARMNTRTFMIKLRSYIIKDNIAEAISLCKNSPGPVAKVLRKGLIKSGKDKEETRESIESAGREEIYYLERRLSILATIAGAAPLLGFLGTVTGMIRAFMQIQSLGGNVNAAVLAGGIWEALITTAAGLIVGIPTYIFYNYLFTKVQRFVHEIEHVSNELIDLLYEEKEDEFKDREQITQHF
ncbi:MotA/TolQ/ExbB proton channel family protein [candidate division KSB1 bacterium]|nr:MAG: MotA/TolQ/ExbB proton channel family protein [candidate division KSB1 bacterium]